MGTLWKTLCRALVVAAALTSLGLGLRRDAAVRRDQRREPAWSHRLAPLLAAPLHHGEPTALVVPPGLSLLDAGHLFMETVWLRPGVRWLPRRRLPGAGGPCWAVLLGEHMPGTSGFPPGWRRLWQQDGIVVLGRSRRP